MAELIALVGAVASAIAVIATSVRKRQDTDVDELRKRAEVLERKVQAMGDELEQVRAEAIACERTVYQLRRLLAQHGIEETTT